MLYFQRMLLEISYKVVKELKIQLHDANMNNGDGRIDVNVLLNKVRSKINFNK